MDWIALWHNWTLNKAQFCHLGHVPQLWAALFGETKCLRQVTHCETSGYSLYHTSQLLLCSASISTEFRTAATEIGPVRRNMSKINLTLDLGVRSRFAYCMPWVQEHLLRWPSWTSWRALLWSLRSPKRRANSLSTSLKWQSLPSSLPRQI